MKLKLTEKWLASVKAPKGDAVQAYYWDEMLTGFGVVVGATARTFVCRAWVKGKRAKVKIGIAGRPRPDGLLWTVQLARDEAKRQLGDMARGINPNAAKRPASAPSAGPTLRAALEYHVGKMERGENRRGKVCSPRSIETIRGGVTKHFAVWLDRPLVDLTTDELEAVLKHAEKSAPRVGGSNPDNPPGRALSNHLLAFISTIWRSYHRRYGLPVANPAERLMPGALKPRDSRIAHDGFAAWYAAVQTLAPIRRDLQLAALFLGIRADGMRNLRWEDLDDERRLLQVRRAKGDRPYTVPITDTVREIFERRRRENAIEFAEYGGDHGWIFPSLTRAKPFQVIAVAEAKERRLDKATGERVNVVPGIQASRKTFNSVALEIGISEQERKALMNHEGKGVNVRSYGFPQNWDHLAECAAKIEAALWERIKPSAAKRAPRKLRAVP